MKEGISDLEKCTRLCTDFDRNVELLCSYSTSLINLAQSRPAAKYDAVVQLDKTQQEAKFNNIELNNKPQVRENIGDSQTGDNVKKTLRNGFQYNSANVNNVAANHVENIQNIAENKNPNTVKNAGENTNANGNKNVETVSKIHGAISEISNTDDGRNIQNVGGNHDNNVNKDNISTTTKNAVNFQNYANNVNLSTKKITPNNDEVIPSNEKITPSHDKSVAGNSITKLNTGYNDINMVKTIVPESKFKPKVTGPDVDTNKTPSNKLDVRNSFNS